MSRGLAGVRAARVLIELRPRGGRGMTGRGLVGCGAVYARHDPCQNGTHESGTPAA